MSIHPEIADVLAGRRRWTVVTADCLDILPTLPDGCVDAVVTDPPYAQKTHAGARTGDGSKQLVNFAPMDDAEFLTQCEAWVRVSTAWVVATCDWRHAAAAENAGLPVVRLGVWVKPDAAPQFTGDRPGTGWEAVMILHRPGKKVWNGGGRHAVWTRGRDRSEFHPSVKPVSLLIEWVNLFTQEGAVILDPFAGSGTTGVAAIKTGRRFIGIEIDEKYASIARRRIAEADTHLFNGVGT